MQYKLKDWNPEEILYEHAIDVPHWMYDDLIRKCLLTHKELAKDAVTIQVNMTVSFHIARPIMEMRMYHLEVPVTRIKHTEESSQAEPTRMENIDIIVTQPDKPEEFTR